MSSPKQAKKIRVCCLILAAVHALAPASVAQTAGQNQSKAFGPDACGPVDPAYIRTATETGGIPMFLQRSETGKAFQLMRESNRNNVSTVLWATGAVESTPRELVVPLDSTTQRVTFTFSTDTKGNRFTVMQPSGAPVEQGMANAEITELNCGRILTLASPSPGTWRIQASGKGRFWLEVKAQSEIYFIKGEFVKLGGRPAHEGFFPISGQPVAGFPATVEASLSAASTRSTEFFFVDQSGSEVQKLHLKPQNEDRDFLEFLGQVELPKGPFRLAVMGRDANGYRYQRFISRLFHAEEVELNFHLAKAEIAPGETTEAFLTVRNIGSPRTFRISVVDIHRWLTSVEPKEFALAAGEEASVRVVVAVPGTATDGSTDDLIAVATSTTGPATSNSSIAHITVARSTVSGHR